MLCRHVDYETNLLTTGSSRQGFFWSHGSRTASRIVQFTQPITEHYATLPMGAAALEAMEQGWVTGDELGEVELALEPFGGL